LDKELMKRRDFLKALAVAPLAPSVLAAKTDSGEIVTRAIAPFEFDRNIIAYFYDEPAIWTPSSGDMYYNCFRNTLNVFNGNKWEAVQNGSNQT
jgi:hypothetical protein